MRFSIALLAATACLLSVASCSKDKTDKPVDRTVEFKNTTWAGEFQYTSGGYVSPQPFSVSFAADGTLTWADLTSQRPGGTWMVRGDTISITFPNNTTISATVINDSWSDFKGGAAAGVIVTSLTKSTVVDAAKLSGTEWSGSMGGSELNIVFLPGQKMNYTLGGGGLQVVPYTIEGAGIRYSFTTIVSTAVNYVVFSNNNSTMKGLERLVSGFPPLVNYYSFTTIKQ